MSEPHSDLLNGPEAARGRRCGEEDALWEAVQARLGAVRAGPVVDKVRAHRFSKRWRAQHLLTGLLECGLCGGPVDATLVQSLQ
jgi:hypothetical protein